MQLRAAGLLVISVALTVFAADPTTPNYEIKPIVLPGANGPVTLDYFAYDPATRKLWLPASNLGSVAVIEEKTDAVSQITGFTTDEIERRRQKSIVGTTSETLGDRVAY